MAKVNVVLAIHRVDDIVAVGWHIRPLTVDEIL